MELKRTVIFFVGFLVAVALGLPTPDVKDEVEAVKPVKTYGDQPIVDTGYFSGWDSPFPSNTFGGLFDSLDGVMDRMRQQIAALLNRFPTTKGGNSTAELPVFPGFPSIDDIDLSKGNTTSVTKIVDGHKVVINETEYKNEDDFGGTFFKVRIIDVKPDSSELTTEKEAEAVPENATPFNKDREYIDNSFENEIPKSKEAEQSISTENHYNVSSNENTEKTNNEFDNIETFDEVDSIENDSTSPTRSTNQNQKNSSIEYVESRFEPNKSSEWSEEDSEWSNIGPVASVDTNAIESEENSKEHLEQRPFDLSRDTYVNELLANSGAIVNPDAEVFFVAQTPGKTSRSEKLMDPR